MADSAETLTLPPTPSPRRPLGGLLFSSRPEAEEVSPSALPSPLDLSDGASAAPLDAPSDPSGPGRPSSTGSTPAPERGDPVRAVDKAGITRTAIEVVNGAGTIAHQFLAVDEVDQALDRWLLTEEEAEQIGTPLGSLAARHSGGVAGLGNPDVNDVLSALVGVAVYAVRQLSLATAARNFRAGRQNAAVQTPPGGPADTAVDV